MQLPTYLPPGGTGAVSSSPCLALGRSPPCRRACSRKLALRAVGAARGLQGGGASFLGVGCPGLGALPRLTAPPWGVRPGPAIQRLLVRGGWARGPVIVPTARSCELVLHAVGTAPGLPGGGASCLGVGRQGLGALPRPTAHPWGVRPGPAIQTPLVRGVLARGPVTIPTACSCEMALRAVGAAPGQPGGGAPLACVLGVQGWAISHVQPPVLEACGRGLPPSGCGCGGLGRGSPSLTPQRALLRACFGHFGAARGRPRGGGPLAWV